MNACSFRVFALLFLGGAWNLSVQVAADSPDHPHVAITAPSPGRLSEIVTVSALATNHDAAAGVQFLVNEQPIGAADTQAPYSIRWDTLTRSNGSYTLSASVRDTGGISHTSPPVSVTVANIELNDFVNEVVVSGLAFVATMEFLPNGKILVAELGGTIRVVQPGGNQADSTPFAVLPADRGGDTGLLDITIDPEFTQNRFYYVIYTHIDGRDRVSRLTASEDWNSTVPGSEFVLWQNDGNRNSTHHGATVVFGPDGKLYISTGEQFGEIEAQSLSSYFGKILRINRDGSIPTDNPFYDGTGPNKDEIWAYGLRNPFRMSFDAPTGRLFIGDVGGNETATSYEEINLGVAGANYGWPLCEGPCSERASTVRAPIHSYPHAGRDGSVTGGLVYRGTDFPEEFRGSYFFADYVQNWIKRLTFDPDGNVEAVRNFIPANGAVDDLTVGDIVELKQGPDGALYYLDLSFGIDNAEEHPNEGTLRRVRYVGMRNRPPVARISADPVSGLAPLSVSFSGGTSSDGDGDPLTFDWDFGDGSSAPGSDVEHVYDQRGQFTAILTVFDGTDRSFTSVRIQVGQPPAGTILSPEPGRMFRAGEELMVEGTASDPEDGVLPASAFQWNVVFHHESHLHPVLTVSGTNRFRFTIPTSGHDYSGSTSYEIFLTVNDSDGLGHTRSVSVFPDKVNIVLDTVPAGLTVKVDGIAKATPFTNDSLIGFEHEIEAPNQASPSGSGGYRFLSWSDGLPQLHTLVVPGQGGNNIATFSFAEDLTPPELSSVTALDAQTLRLVFSEPVETVSAEIIAHYEINNGVSVSWALLEADPRIVTLVTTPMLSGNYNLTINYVTDRATPPNPIAPDSQGQFSFTPMSPRVTAGLVALYGFEEGVGTTVHDVSGAGAPLDLDILDPASIQWIGGSVNGVHFTSGGSSIRSPGGAGKIHAAVTATSQLSLEAWVTPASLAQSDPVRIATISQGTSPSDVNVHLGQDFDSASYRLRTTENSFHSMHASGAFTSIVDPRHVVVTYDGTAQRLYVDGVQHVTIQPVSGGLANWNAAYPLVLGNEATLDRSWLGIIHLVAIYNTALSPIEIQQNYDAGPSLSSSTVDTEPPTILRVVAADRDRVRLLFSEAVEAISSQSIGNYAIDNGVVISQALLESDGRTVTLSTSPLLERTLYTLSCSNIIDQAVPGNPMTGEARLTFFVPVQTIEILGIRQNPDRTVTIELEGAAWCDYSIQATSDLSLPGSWSNAATGVLGADGRGTFTDAITNRSRRYYRAIRP